MSAESSSSRPSMQLNTRSVHTTTPSSSTSSSPQARVRPLPPVPIPAPGPSGPSSARASSESSRPSLRPLPRTPPTTFPSPAFSTLAAPPPSTANVSERPRLSRPKTMPVNTTLSPSRLPRDGLRLQPASAGGASLEDATSPATPIPPSPATRRRKSVHKLARHLGEDASKVSLHTPYMPALPPPMPPSLPAPPRNKPAAVRQAQEEDDEDVDETPLVFRTRLNPCFSDDEDEDEDDDDSVFGVRRPIWTTRPRTVTPRLSSDKSPSPPPVIQTIDPEKRESKHWYEVENGRLVEQDYADVLHKLRKLR